MSAQQLEQDTYTIAVVITATGPESDENPAMIVTAGEPLTLEQSGYFLSQVGKALVDEARGEISVDLSGPVEGQPVEGVPVALAGDPEKLDGQG